MISKKTVFLLIGTIAVISFTSCVSSKKYQEMETARKQCDEENKALSAKNIELNTLANEQRASIDKLGAQNKTLVADSSRLGNILRDTKSQLGRMTESYNDLDKQYKDLLGGNKSETAKILAELQQTKENLQLKEDQLRKMESDLNEKKSSLDLISADLADKEKRLSELQAILDKKDSAVKALKAKVSEALLGFENKGLTIKIKNGKVYVSMDESLLFATGSYDVSSKGTEALVKLGKVLEQNVDINIMVEGHTDNVAYKSGTGPINDNWDLSVMRATSVVKILVKNSKISPVRIIAAGRGEFVPLDMANTTEARGKNRRTEIILSPKLDELFKLIEDN